MKENRLHNENVFLNFLNLISDQWIRGYKLLRNPHPISLLHSTPSTQSELGLFDYLLPGEANDNSSLHHNFWKWLLNSMNLQWQNYDNISIKRSEMRKMAHVVRNFPFSNDEWNSLFIIIIIIIIIFSLGKFANTFIILRVRVLRNSWWGGPASS